MSVLMLWIFAHFAHGIEITVSEVVTITDTVTIMPAVVINVAETVGVSDSVGTKPSVWIEVSEPVTVSDTAYVTPLPVVQINISETVTVADTVSVHPSIMINISESVGVLDSVGTQPSVRIEVSEPVTISDTVDVSPLPVVQIDIAEPIAVADSVSIQPSVIINISETVGVSDSVWTQTSVWIEVSEPVTVSDTVDVTPLPVVQIDISETVTVADTVSVHPSVMINISESVGVFDSVGTQPSVWINISEPVMVSDTVSVDVLMRPIANPGDLYIAVEGLSLVLDGSGSIDPDGSIVLYEWDIDDDGTYDYSSPSPTQNHIYPYESIYTIRLRVTDNSGFIDEAVTYVYVLDSSPTADFISYPVSGTAPLTVYFFNYSDGFDQPLSYEWDFENDGTVDSTLSNPWHEYPLGIYSVKLKVTDSDGSTSTLLRTDYISSCLSPVRIIGTPPLYYITIQPAYDEAYDSEVIQSREQVFNGNVYIDRNITVYFQGGFNCDYSINGGVTVIEGNILLNDGKLIIESGTLQVR